MCRLSWCNQKNGQHLEIPISEYHGIHLVNLSFLQELPITHEPLVSTESVLTQPTGLMETYGVDEVMVLYPGERTESGIPYVSSLRIRETTVDALCPIVFFCFCQVIRVDEQS